ncbi:MAG: RsmE family RNA methyltransferase [bacterium]
MELYYLAAGATADGSVRFDADESRHIARVMRHRPGEFVRAVDGQGMEYRVRLSEVTDSAVSGRVASAGPGQGEPRVRVTLAQGILKGDQLTEVVEAATELGAVEVVPFRSARTVGGYGPRRAARLRRVALEAMKCSRRSVLPEVRDAVDLDGLAARCGDFGLALVAWEDENEQVLSRALVGGPASVLVVVGPEGGLDRSEVELLREAGARSFSLGPRPLRARLAGAVALASLMYVLGEVVPPGQVLAGKEV